MGETEKLGQDTTMWSKHRNLKYLTSSGTEVDWGGPYSLRLPPALGTGSRLGPKTVRSPDLYKCAGQMSSLSSDSPRGTNVICPSTSGFTSSDRPLSDVTRTS